MFGEIVRIEEGRGLREDDRGVCVVGHLVANEYFDEKLEVNDRIKAAAVQSRWHEMFVRVYDISKAEDVAEEIAERIDENHKLEDFTQAITMGSLIEQLEDVFKNVTSCARGHRLYSPPRRLHGHNEHHVDVGDGKDS